MRLLFVGTHCVGGGGESHFVTLARAMAAAGHQVGAVICPASPIATGLADSAVRIYHGRFRNALDVKTWRVVQRAVEDFKPDWLIGSFGKEYWPLTFISRWSRTPLALFRHRAPALGALSGYFLPRLAQRFILVSNFLRDLYIARGTPAANVSVLYNPFDLAHCCPSNAARATVRRRLGIEHDAVVLGYVGRMFSGKGIFHLFAAADAAMQLVPNLHCLWVGDGPDGPGLRTAIAASPCSQQHHYVAWTEEVREHYNAMDILAAPSIQTETFGRTLVEAQACGVPVLGSDVGGIAEAFAPGKTGLLLKSGDLAEWRDAILSLCDPVRRLPLANAARNYVLPRFDTSVIAAQFEKLLTSSPVKVKHASLAAP